MQPGTVCKLEDIHYFKKTSVAWFVSDLVTGSEKERVHFTVHRGDKPIGEFIPASDDDSRVRDFRAEMEVQERLKREGRKVSVESKSGNPTEEVQQRSSLWTVAHWHVPSATNAEKVGE